MLEALGMIEYNTVSTGIVAADTMVKTSAVEIIEAHVVCPGKYICLIRGDLSAVNAAIEASQKSNPDKLVDSFVLGNPHDSIFPAIYGASNIENPKALGVLETYTAPSIIVAADVAAKTAMVDLIELRIAKGMCGKSYMLITGEVAAVKAAIERAKQEVIDEAVYLDSAVIASPDNDTWKNIM